MIGLRRGVVGKTVDPNLKLELKFNTNTFTDLLGNDPAGANDYVRSWRSTVGGHLLTQAMDAARPQRVSDGIYFDGEDYMQVSGWSFNPSSSWTIEAFLNFSGTGNNNNIISSPQNDFNIQYNGSAIAIGYAGVNLIGIASSVTANAWFHLAVVNDNGTTRVYKSGVQLATGGNFPNNTITTFNLAYRPSQAWYLLGKMTDVRLYTSCIYPNGTTFTPPTRSA